MVIPMMMMVGVHPAGPWVEYNQWFEDIMLDDGILSNTVIWGNHHRRHSRPPSTRSFLAILLVRGWLWSSCSEVLLLLFLVLLASIRHCHHPWLVSLSSLRLLESLSSSHLLYWTGLIVVFFASSFCCFPFVGIVVVPLSVIIVISEDMIVLPRWLLSSFVVCVVVIVAILVVLVVDTMIRVLTVRTSVNNPTNKGRDMVLVFT